MGTFILNKYQAPKIKLNRNKYNVMIRITSPNDEFLPLEDESIYQEILELKFYDFTQETNGLTVFDHRHLDTIIAFFKKHKNSDNIVIHCDLGASRSAAVAIGWFFFTDQRSSIYKVYHSKKHMPNHYIVQQFARYFNKSMKYIEKWEQDRLNDISEI